MKTSLFSKFGCLLILAASSATGARAADPLDNWELLYPKPTASLMKHAAYGDGVWVALGGDGGFGGGVHSKPAVLLSDDGLAWRTGGSIPMNYAPHSVTFGNGLWVTVGRTTEATEAAMLTSTNGMDWEIQTSGLDQWKSFGINVSLFQVVLGNGLWIAMGNAGRYLTSTDGITWTPRSASVIADAHFIAYGGGKWLLLSMDGGGRVFASESADGLTWTKHPVPVLRKVQFANGAWVGTSGFTPWGSGIYSSPDGINWTLRHPWETGEERQFDMVLAGDQWIVAGAFGSPGSVHNPVVFTSPNGLVWTSHDAPSSPGRNLNGLAYGNDLLVAVVDKDILTSTNGIDWTSRFERLSQTQPLHLNKVSYAAGLWVATGEEEGNYPLTRPVILTSEDGREWIRPNLPETTGRLAGLAYGNGRWLAAGSQILEDDPEAPRGLLFSSENGQDWTIETFGSRTHFREVTFANGLWMIRGERYNASFSSWVSVFMTSGDGVNWTERTFTTPVPYSITFGGGKWVALGADGTNRFSLVSIDGVNWSQHPIALGAGSWLSQLHYAQGRWIAVGGRPAAGDSAAIYATSLDGLNWTVQDLPAAPGRLGSITFLDGRWIAGGSPSFFGFVSSVDGTNWTAHANINGSIAFDGSKFVVVQGELLWSSAVLSPPAAPVLSIRRNGNEIWLQITGEVGRRYEIQQTPNLLSSDWRTVDEITLTTESNQIQVTPPSSGKSFWRARVP